MLKLAVLSFIVAYVYAGYYEEQTEYWMKKTNGRGMPWKAGYNKYLEGKTEEQVKRLMGTKMDRKGLANVPRVYHNVDAAALPTSFTSGVDKWQMCASTINYIKDQADCGSCWAVSASSVVANRICIANNGAHLPKLNEPQPGIIMSAEQIMSCCYGPGNEDQGCGGGYPIDAMKYWQMNGIVTGGWYGSNCGCQPYMIPPCGPQGCSAPEANTPQCMSTCSTGKKYQPHKGKTAYMIGGTAAQIQQEIYMNGPVECAFDVYQNFMSYTSGVYNQTQGQLMGGHAVTIVGWGVDSAASGMPYWIIHNSWNTTWGMNGVFWFLRGSDLAGMEDQCVAGMAMTADSGYALSC